MIEKLHIVMDCLFLPDTQMAELEKEQNRMRSLYLSLNSGAPLPFAALPPFCAFGYTDGIAPLIVQKAQNHKGWIVRPISVEVPKNETENIQTENPIARPPDFPAYPPLPDLPCFILGYAGDFADDLLTEAAAEGQTFSVQIWYRCPMTVRFEFEKDAHYGVFFETGAAVWKKRRS